MKFVATLPPHSAPDPTDYSRRALEAGVDLLEVRGDLTPDIAPFASRLPLLVSPRGQSGAWVRRLNPAYVDLALGEADPACGGVRIRSYHDHERTPGLVELRLVLEQLAGEGGEVLKVATTVRSYEDVATLDALHHEAVATVRSKMRAVVILGMGEKAHLVRMLSPWRNVLTYVAVDARDASAPGQLPVSMYARERRATEPQQRFGILGGEGLVTLSPWLHNAWFRRHGVDAVYAAFPSRDLDDAWRHLTSLGVRGFSVTAPHKRAIVDRLDRLAGRAAAVGSVNTVVRDGDAWVGWQTDVQGIVEGYPFLRGRESAVVCGTGGAARAAIVACRELGIGRILVLGRDHVRLSELASTFGVATGTLGAASRSAGQVWIWTIPVDVSIDLPPAVERADAVDLRYGRDSGFLAHANRSGYACHDGVAMFVHQARAQFELFTGRSVDAHSTADAIANATRMYSHEQQQPR